MFQILTYFQHHQVFRGIHLFSASPASVRSGFGLLLVGRVCSLFPPWPSNISLKTMILFLEFSKRVLQHFSSSHYSRIFNFSFSHYYRILNFSSSPVREVLAPCCFSISSVCFGTRFSPEDVYHQFIVFFVLIIITIV